MAAKSKKPAPARKAGPSSKPPQFKDYSSQGGQVGYIQRRMAYLKDLRAYEAGQKTSAKTPAKVAAKQPAGAKVSKPAAPMMPTPKPITPAPAAAPAAPIPTGPSPAQLGRAVPTLKNEKGIIRADPNRPGNTRFDMLAGGFSTSPFWRP